MDDNCVFIFCSMSSETAVTFTGGHFNQAVFAVLIYLHREMFMSTIFHSYSFTVIQLCLICIV